jgi:hypothetical protein
MKDSEIVELLKKDVYWVDAPADESCYEEIEPGLWCKEKPIGGIDLGEESCGDEPLDAFSPLYYCEKHLVKQFGYRIHQ